MIKPRIIVTGETGKTGCVVARELLKAGYPVRAMEMEARESVRASDVRRCSRCRSHAFSPGPDSVRVEVAERL